LCHKWPRIFPHVVNTSRSFPHSWLITGFVTRLTLVEQELPTLPEQLSSPPVFSGVRVTRSLVLSVCFIDRCLSFCTFSFGHCVVCPSSIYVFWLPLWYLQTLLIIYSWKTNFWLSKFKFDWRRSGNDKVVMRIRKISAILTFRYWHLLVHVVGNYVKIIKCRDYI